MAECKINPKTQFSQSAITNTSTDNLILNFHITDNDASLSRQYKIENVRTDMALLNQQSYYTVYTHNSQCH